MFMRVVSDENQVNEKHTKKLLLFLSAFTCRNEIIVHWHYNGFS